MMLDKLVEVLNELLAEERLSTRKLVGELLMHTDC